MEIDLIKGPPYEKSQFEANRRNRGGPLADGAPGDGLPGRAASDTVNVVGYSIVAKRLHGPGDRLLAHRRRPGRHVHELLRRLDDPGRGRRRRSAGRRRQLLPQPGPGALDQRRTRLTQMGLSEGREGPKGHRHGLGRRHRREARQPAGHPLVERPHQCRRQDRDARPDQLG